MSKSPDAFRTISEVADWLGVQAHVLRFWESKFTQLKPVKRAGGRRYYRPADMLLLGGIRKLLHEDGLSIKEVQALLRDMGAAHVSAMSHALDGEDDDPALTAAAPEAEIAPEATADIAPPPVETPMPEQPQAQVDQAPPVTAAAAPVAEQQQESVPPQAPPTQDAGVTQPTPTAPAATPPGDPLPPADMLADDWQGSLDLADEAAPLESSENVLGFPQADPPPAADIAETPLFAAAPESEPAAPIADTLPEPADPSTAVVTDSPDGPATEDTLVAAAGLQPEQPLDFSAAPPDQPAPMEFSSAEPAPADPTPVHPDPAPYPPHDLDEAARQIDALEFSGGFDPSADVDPAETIAPIAETPPEPAQAEPELPQPEMTEPELTAPKPDAMDLAARLVDESEPEPAELAPATPIARPDPSPAPEVTPEFAPEIAPEVTPEAAPEFTPASETAETPLAEQPQQAESELLPEPTDQAPIQAPMDAPASATESDIASPLQPPLADRPATSEPVSDSAADPQGDQSTQADAAPEPEVAAQPDMPPAPDVAQFSETEIAPEQAASAEPEAETAIAAQLADPELPPMATPDAAPLGNAPTEDAAELPIESPAADQQPPSEPATAALPDPAPVATTALDSQPPQVKPGVLAHLAGLQQLPPQSQDAIRACATELRELLNTSAN